MSTDQSYDPQHTPANPVELSAQLTPPTAPTAAQALSTSDERLARILASDGASAYLLDLLSLIQEHKDTEDPIGAINAIFRRWAKGEALTADESRNSYGRILDLLEFLNQLAVYHDCILIESDNEQQF